MSLWSFTVTIVYYKSKNRKSNAPATLFLGLNTKPSALSMSSLNNVSSGQNLRNGSGKEPNGGSAGGPPPAPNEEASLYEKLTWAHKYDPRSKEEVILNRRVGFYRFKSDLGAGNFSKVKLAHHQLTKGMEISFSGIKKKISSNGMEIWFYNSKCPINVESKANFEHSAKNAVNSNL